VSGARISDSYAFSIVLLFCLPGVERIGEACSPLYLVFILGSWYAWETWSIKAGDRTIFLIPFVDPVLLVF